MQIGMGRSISGGGSSKFKGSETRMSLSCELGAGRPLWLDLSDCVFAPDYNGNENIFEWPKYVGFNFFMFLTILCCCNCEIMAKI